MMLRFLMAGLLFLSFIQPAKKPDTIQWSVDRRLNWSDFKASPPESGANAALTSSGVLLSFSTNGEDFHYELSCNFAQNSSWGRVKNDYILAHEQGHFDIAELYTRKLNKALKGYRYRRGSLNNDINTIYRNMMKELLQAQDQYDQQTDHSRNEVEQKNWLVKIKKSLDDMERFADYR